MGATMAVIMLSLMLSMYASKSVNAAIFVGAVLAFALSLWLVRSQETVQDRSFMSAMIPHHSIAIMTSGRAELTDARVEKLAHDIILAQNLEISEMRYLIAAIDAAGGTRESLQEVPDADWRGETESIFALEEGLTVGYRGFYDCDL